MSQEKHGEEPGMNTLIVPPDLTIEAPLVPHISATYTNDSTCPHEEKNAMTTSNLADDPKLKKLHAQVEDLLAHLPNHNYIHIPTGQMWPAASVDGSLSRVPMPDGTTMPASAWLDKERAVLQQVWDPSKPQIISDLVMVAAAYADKPGARIFNRYLRPTISGGNPTQAKLWRDHLKLLYPNDYEHIENYFASKLQHPGIKINHALVLGGAPGIGKDTLLEPVKLGVGPGNWQEISPAQMSGRFNGWVKSVMLRISEAHHTGNKESMAFYEQTKTLFAGPPDAIRVDEKNIPEYYVANVCGVVITTNNRTDALYLPADDRRHYVAWSDIHRDHINPGYWNQFYQWLNNGGREHVVAYLLSKDISRFDPKAAPPKTPGFWTLVQANEPPESADLREAIDRLGNPTALRFADLKSVAENHLIGSLAVDLLDKKQSKSWAARLDKVGYTPVRNPDTKEGLFSVKGKYFAVYARKEISLSDQIKAARNLG